MFNKPNFCCHCGEKIERPEPSVFDSNRFCDVCKYDFVGSRMLPFIYVGLMTVVGLFGLGGLLRGPAALPNMSTKTLTANRPNASPSVAQNPPKSVNTALTANVRLPPKLPEVPIAASEERLSFCGAETKKGTPCSRRVKDGGRCWQHQGQNSVQAAEKSPSVR